MADVVKVVDGMADETGKISDKLAANGKTYAQNYETMVDSLKDLSTQIPYTFEDLTRLAAAAGQSGKSFEDLTQTDFLKDVAHVGHGHGHLRRPGGQLGRPSGSSPST